MLSELLLWSLNSAIEQAMLQVSGLLKSSFEATTKEIPILMIMHQDTRSMIICMILAKQQQQLQNKTNPLINFALLLSLPSLIWETLLMQSSSTLHRGIDERETWSWTSSFAKIRRRRRLIVNQLTSLHLHVIYYQEEVDNLAICKLLMQIFSFSAAWSLSDLFYKRGQAYLCTTESKRKFCNGFSCSHFFSFRFFRSPNWNSVCPELVYGFMRITPLGSAHVVVYVGLSGVEDSTVI